MTDPVKPRGTRRRAQALETRALVLAAARRLFAAQGYAATTIVDIAREAGVVQQTIYDSLGSKRGVLLALQDVIDEEAGVGPLALEIARTRDPRQAIALGVRLTRQLNERCGDLVQAMLSAAAVEPDIAEAFAEGMSRHRAGVGLLIEGIRRGNALAGGFDTESGAALMGVLTRPESYISLHKDYGWTFDECEERLTAALTRLLLKPAGPRTQ
jgi:AcrR family transcriptional regulator